MLERNSEQSQSKAVLFFVALLPRTVGPVPNETALSRSGVAAEVQLDVTASSSGKLQVVSLAASALWLL